MSRYDKLMARLLGGEQIMIDRDSLTGVIDWETAAIRRRVTSKCTLMDQTLN